MEKGKAWEGEGEAMRERDKMYEGEQGGEGDREKTRSVILVTSSQCQTP